MSGWLGRFCPINHNPKRRRGISGKQREQLYPSLTSRVMKTHWMKTSLAGFRKTKVTVRF